MLQIERVLAGDTMDPATRACLPGCKDAVQPDMVRRNSAGGERLAVACVLASRGDGARKGEQ